MKVVLMGYVGVMLLIVMIAAANELSASMITEFARGTS